jgi:hypothetical protein
VRIQGRLETGYGTGGTDQSVTVFLPGRFYKRAIRAHGAHQHVRIAGLAENGRITAVRRLDVIDPPAESSAG